MSIIENYRKIEESVREAAGSCGRNAEEIRIIAVSKNFPRETVQEAIDSGIELFGENKVKEAKEKIPGLSGTFIMHMIGHLQSNKAKDAVRLFDLIHSLDKRDTAEKINREAEKIEKVQKILIQVNTSGELSKSGTDPENALNIIDAVADMKNTETLGLMTMAPYTRDTALIRDCFRKLKDTLETINSKLGTNMRELSMGMSSDYRIAIEEGATMLRIGTAIFGERRY